MPVNDPVADLLTRIRNANKANHDSLEVDSSKLKIEVLRILQEEGYIKAFEIIKHPVQDNIKVTLKYGPRHHEKVITDLKRVSKPGLRIYRSHEKLPTVLRGLGIAIVSTSHGVMTAKKAKKLGIGGEVLALVW